MLAPAEAAIRARIDTGFTSLPVRWQNEDWGGVNPQGSGLPFVEIEIIGGRNSIHAFSSVGTRIWIHLGLLRVYIAQPYGTGMTAAYATADQFAALLERQEFGQNTDRSQLARMQDVSINDNAATLEEGSYAVMMVSCPFEFFYTA